MIPSPGAGRRRVFLKAVLLLAAAGLLAASLLALPGRGDGPASRCEGRGGHYLVGPAGETACLSPNTFLPMPE